MPEKINDLHAENLVWYQALIDTHSEITLKGKKMLYTSVNGHIFSIMNKDGNLGLRLPKYVRDHFIENYQTKLHESYGAVMKEYVRIPNSLLTKTDKMKEYLIISFDYVKTLKPKPTTKKKS